jgi:hypothetical protein
MKENNKKVLYEDPSEEDHGVIYDPAQGGLIIPQRRVFGDEIAQVLAGVKLLSILDASKEGKDIKVVMKEKLKKFRDQAGANKDDETFLGFQSAINRLSIED